MRLQRRIWTVYWIRTAELTKIESEGYVGACENFRNRMAHHLRNSSNNNIRANLYRDRDSLFVEIVGEFYKREYAFNLEKHLRPHAGIGWNQSPGNHMLSRDKTIPKFDEIREILPLNMQWTMATSAPAYRVRKIRID